MHHPYFIWTFIMNNIIFLFILSTLSLYAFSDQVKININAQVTERTCSISAGKKDFTVELPPGNLNGKPVGIPFAQTAFSIEIVDCPSNISTAHVAFVGNSDPVFPNLLGISTASSLAAKGIAVGILNNQNNIIDIRNNVSSYSISNNENLKSFDFKAAYIKTSKTATPGKVQAVVSFEISYD